MSREPRRSIGRLQEITDTDVKVSRRRTSRLQTAAPTTCARPEAHASGVPTSSSRGPAQRSHRTGEAPLPMPALLPPIAAADWDPGRLLDDNEPHLALHVPAQASSNSLALSQSTQSFEDEVVAGYWYALVHVGGVFRLEPTQYVLQEWDTKSASLKLGVYVHLVRLPRGPNEYGSSCSCARWKAVNLCLHDIVLRQHVTTLELLPIIAPAPLPPAVFLHQTPFRDIYIYSCVASPGRYDSGKRVIVSYQRDGRWHCQSCRYSESCKHKPYAAEHAALSGFLFDGSDGTAVPPIEDGADDVEGALLVAVAGRDERKHGCVSYLTIPAPRWCSLPHEDTQSIRPPESTLSFPLDALSRCSCGTTLQSIGASLPPTTTIRAVLYGYTSRSDVQLEVLACPACNHHRRLIGPDLGSVGIFNWSNTILFTHELLNAYTNAFTASETPFSAFCVMIRRQYEDHTSSMQFCSDETFVCAWFAFVQLQDLGNTMTCPTCGPSPAVVIADGVSLATHSSKLTPHIRPPTYTDTSSERVETISSYKARALPAIPQKDVRSVVLRCLEVTASPLKIPVDLPDISKVEHTHPSIAELLRLIAKTPNAILRRTYRNFAQQVAAPDIVLQLVPYKAVPYLRQLADTGLAVDWLQALIPALGRILEVLRALVLPVPDEVCGVARWLADRTEEVYNRLAQHDPAPPSTSSAADGDNSDDWRITGTCYGLPAVRTRRIYPKLRHDTDPTDINAEEMGECNKFFKTYPRNRLAGGILVLWCTHSICLGFHTIPVAEGRNDVFSAIYTRFPTAPQIVVYDFACQLAPYCFVREARYFSDTRFLIDELHARDHTKCGQACFASNAMQYDERIRAVNTSAGECGNGGVGRIRKSVSYMIYEHAVVYTRVFMNVWNRMITRRMAKTANGT
ncbi:hypothetical protein BV20DRAFT_965977 [Pilatotrama ljubarskyi]|nr:hypothetical protein BV20DRAFT_965977 [Pilatotrama ljubarskyi]